MDDSFGSSLQQFTDGFELCRAKRAVQYGRAVQAVPIFAWPWTSPGTHRRNRLLHRLQEPV